MSLIRDLALGLLVVTVTLMASMVEMPKPVVSTFESMPWLRFAVVLAMSFFAIRESSTGTVKALAVAFTIAGLFEMVLLAMASAGSP
jgi:hypothetical protein